MLQARILEWVAISFSRGSSRPRDRTRVSRIGGRRFNLWATREAESQGKRAWGEKSEGSSSLVENFPNMCWALLGSLGQEDLLEEEMATNSSILAWKNSMDRGPGGLQSTGSHRVRTHLSDWAYTYMSRHLLGTRAIPGAFTQRLHNLVEKQTQKQLLWDECRLWDCATGRCYYPCLTGKEGDQWRYKGQDNSRLHQSRTRGTSEQAHQQMTCMSACLRCGGCIVSGRRWSLKGKKN